MAMRSISIEAVSGSANWWSMRSVTGYNAAKALIQEDTTAFFHDVAHAAMLGMKEDVKRAIKTFSRK